MDDEEKDRYRELLARIRRRGWVMFRGASHFSALNDLVEKAEDRPDPELERQIGQGVSELLLHDVDDPDEAEEHDVGRVMAPVFGADGAVAIVLNLLVPETPTKAADLIRMLDRLVAGTAAVSHALIGDRQEQPGVRGRVPNEGA